MDLNFLTIKAARSALDNGEISSLAITEACLNQIKTKDGQIKACLLVDETGALKAAKEADRRLAQGDRSPLLGIPYLVKDLIMTKGLKTTAASKILEHYHAPYDATVISRLKEAGAVLLAKTNLDEFAHGASTENSAFQITCNPWDLERVPGGSSGGSSAALAAGMGLFSLGSDTGGSIRQPASFCNLFGFKPSYGRVSRFGLLSMTSSTDVIGPFCRSSEDLAMVMSVISGQDKRDANTIQDDQINYSSLLKTKRLKLRIGVVSEHFSEALDRRIKASLMETLKELEKAGHDIIEINLAANEYSIPVYYIITPSELSSNLARFNGLAWARSGLEASDLQSFYKKHRGQGFGPEVKRRIMLGTFALSGGYNDAYYKQAQAVREMIRLDYQHAFSKVDLIISPTTPHVAFKIGSQVNNPLAMYLEDTYLSGASLAGLPAVSIPGGFLLESGKDLPFGFQLIGPATRDDLVLQGASILEKINNYNERRP